MKTIPLKLKIYVGLRSDMTINPQFKKHINQLYQIQYIIKKLVLLVVDGDKNGLLFRKWLHIMNKIIGYS